MSHRRLKVLIVSAQFPYPAHSGFMMRVYQLARRLAQRHDVTLLSYASPEDAAGVEALRAEMDVEVVERVEASRLAKRAAQLSSVASRHPFSTRAVHSPEMQRAIDRLCAEHHFDVIQVEASLLCAFDFDATSGLVLDEHNIEYEVFERMTESERSFARRKFNQIEAGRYRRFEQDSWKRVDACVVTSDREAPVIERVAPHTPTTVVVNGVDLDYFRPADEPPTPHTLVFNGILDYRPNLDAAYHLVDEIWPLVTARFPDARLSIVGRGYPADIKRLTRENVTVTGRVPDLRPYLTGNAVSAVPIRMGGGTRLKVVEGLAMGMAMVSTTLGCEGVGVRDREHLLIGDDAESFAARVIELFENPALGRELGRAGRALMEREYSWDLGAERLDGVYQDVIARRTGDVPVAVGASS
jgi:polysaccharide biosynthesis protein PslH